MKRRGFFGALLGAAAAPVVAKAVESFPEEAETVYTINEADRYPYPDKLIDCANGGNRWEECCSMVAYVETQPSPFNPHRRIGILLT